MDSSIIILCIFLIPYVAYGSPELSSLKEDLFTTKRYDQNMYPSCPGQNHVNVTLDLFLRQIVELKEQTQVLRAMTWMRWSWQDCRLKWDAELWGIGDISVASSVLWIPDVTLYESTGDPLHMIKEYPARVFSDGTVKYNFPALIDTTCKIDMRNFPFDRQRCRLTFASWIYTKKEVDLYPLTKAADVSQYISNGEWDLLEMPTERKEIVYVTRDDVFVEVYFFVVLHRRPIYYLFNIIFPTLLIALVALLSFCLPAASGEKVSLSVTSLLTQTVFMLMLSQEMPATSDTIPLLQRYFALILCIVSISTILTIAVLNVHYRGIHGEPVPRALRRVFLNPTMARIFHPALVRQMRRQHKKQSTGTNNLSSQRNGYTNYADITEFEESYPARRDPGGLKRLKFTQIPIQSISLNGCSGNPRLNATSGTDSATLHQNDAFNPKDSELLVNLREMLKGIIERSKEKQTSKNIEKDWRDLAVVMDRMLFIIMFSAFVISILSLYIPQQLRD